VSEPKGRALFGRLLWNWPHKRLDYWLLGPGPVARCSSYGGLDVACQIGRAQKKKKNLLASLGGAVGQAAPNPNPKLLAHVTTRTAPNERGLPNEGRKVRLGGGEASSSRSLFISGDSPSSEGDSAGLARAHEWRPAGLQGPHWAEAERAAACSSTKEPQGRRGPSPRWACNGRLHRERRARTHVLHCTQTLPVSMGFPPKHQAASLSLWKPQTQPADRQWQDLAR